MRYHRGQESVKESASTSTRVSVKRDAEHWSGGEPEERESHKNMSSEHPNSIW